MKNKTCLKCKNWIGNRTKMAAWCHKWCIATKGDHCCDFFEQKERKIREIKNKKAQKMDWKEFGKPFENIEEIPRAHLLLSVQLSKNLIKCEVCGRWTIKHLYCNKVCAECACGEKHEK